MIQSLLKHYKERFYFNNFYNQLLSDISGAPERYITSNTFLSGVLPSSIEIKRSLTILTKNGDIRIDLPVWFGNPENARKIVVIGLEPRDTDKSGSLNIEREGNYVFATPFAIERPHGPYYPVFQPFFNKNEAFIYFTDVVKSYEINTNDKSSDDKHARQSFRKKALLELSFLKRELEIIQPSKIIALGNVSFDFLYKTLGKMYDIRKVRHPSYGGSRLAHQQFSEILTTL